MKRILAPLLLITLLFPSLAMAEGFICKTTGWNCPVVDYEDLVKRNGLYYKKFTERPFTGKVTGRSQGWFRRGKKDGPWVRFYKNGQIDTKANFKDSELEGPYIVYHKNGQLQEKGNYKNSKKEGPWVFYHDNGRLRRKGTYKDGKEEGPWVYYWKDGSAWDKSTGTYKNGVKVD